MADWSQEVFELLKSRLDKGAYSCFDLALIRRPNHWLKVFLDSKADIFSCDIYHWTITPLSPGGFVENLKRYGTLNPFSAGLWCWDGKTATRIREYYYSGQDECSNKTDEEYYMELEKLAGDLPVKSAVVDPSAASFIEVIRRHKRFTVKKAVNDVLPGIMTTARYLQDGTVKIHRSCKDAIREFGLYRWDEESTEDRPIKEKRPRYGRYKIFCDDYSPA